MSVSAAKRIDVAEKVSNVIVVDPASQAIVIVLAPTPSPELAT